jgi:autophagy-related protein 33
LPSLLHLPSAPLASKALTSLTTTSNLHLRALAGLSTTSFLLAYLLSPRSQKHPYLLWSSLAISTSLVTDFFIPAAKPSTVRTATRKNEVSRRGLSKSRQLDASYEVLSGASDKESEGATSETELEEGDEVNGEEVKQGMERFVVSSVVKAALSGVGFAMAVVGVWGDGA